MSHLFLSLSLYFSVTKDVRLNSTHYLIMKINKERELQNIAINHSADIDYNNFMMIYRECTRRLYSFLTIYTTLPASDSLRFRKIFFILIKMKVTDQLKIIENEIKLNQAQYDLDRLEAKISAYSCGDLRNYEYLPGENLGYKLSVLEKAKFDYSPLALTLNKTIKPADNAKKPVRHYSGLRYGSYSFVEFKRYAEKFKKIPSLDSKNKEIKRF